MQMDIFFTPWTHIVTCSWEYRNELHKYTVQSVQMNLVQLFYLLKIRALEIRKRSNACFSVPFYMGLQLRITASCGRGCGICVNIGSVVSCTTKATGTKAKALIAFGQREQRSGFHAHLRQGDSCLYNQVASEYCLSPALKAELIYSNYCKSEFLGKAGIYL